jgi:hypothetical protein
MMKDKEREYLDSLSQAIHKRQHEETRQQIDELFRRVSKPAAGLPGFNLKNR